MDIFGALNELNRRGTDAFNNVMSAADNLSQHVKLPNADGFRKASDKFIKTTVNEGLIPVPAPTPEIRTGLGYLKSTAGVFGMPFRIGTNDQSQAFYQNTVDAATKTPDGKVIFNQNIEDKDAYNTLGKSISNKDVGRYVGTVDDAGNVIVEDDYDTNQPVKWHLRRVVTGENAEGDPRPISPSDRLISLASAFHKNRQNKGLTNPRPFGTYQNLGTVQK